MSRRWNGLSCFLAPLVSVLALTVHYKQLPIYQRDEPLKRTGK